MFNKLMKYAENIDLGIISQKKITKEPYKKVELDKDYSWFENFTKCTKIKSYIESHISGITVNVLGGQKLASSKRDFIVIRTFKIDNPYNYSVIKICGEFINEKNYATLVYEEYLNCFMGTKDIKTGQISKWERFISEWIDDNYFSEEYYICEDNQLVKRNEKEMCYEIIVSDIEKEVTGLVTGCYKEEPNTIIICKDKQILVTYEKYYVMECED